MQARLVELKKIHIGLHQSRNSADLSAGVHKDLYSALMSDRAELLKSPEKLLIPKLRTDKQLTMQAVPSAV
jgi:hypothetical protein